MATCNICNAPTSLTEGALYTVEELRQIVARGFQPDEAMIAKATAAGWTREQVLTLWRRKLAGPPPSDWSSKSQPSLGWLLCRSCAARAAQYAETPRPRPSSPAGGLVQERAQPRSIPTETSSATEQAFRSPHLQRPRLAASVETSFTTETASRSSRVQRPRPAAPAETLFTTETASRSSRVQRPRRAAPMEIPYAAPETQQTARPRRARWNPLLIVVIAVLGLVLGWIGFNFLASYLSAVRPAQPAAGVVPTTTPSPTDLAEHPTPTAVPPTPGEVGLSGAILTLDDFPVGFQALSSSELGEFGFSTGETGTMLDLSKKLSQAQTYNLTGFLYADPRRIEVVISFLLYPLTLEEQEEFDAELADPAAILEGWKEEDSEQGLKYLDLLPGLDSVGDISIGMTGVGTAEYGTFRQDLVVARRGPIIFILVVLDQGGVGPPISTANWARMLDGRVAAALEGPGE